MDIMYSLYKVDEYNLQFNSHVHDSAWEERVGPHY